MNWIKSFLHRASLKWERRRLLHILSRVAHPDSVHRIREKIWDIDDELAEK